MKTMLLATGMTLVWMAGVATADVEVLDPDVARSQIAESEGVVLVDLFAEW